MRNKLLCCFAAGIFLVTAVYAQAIQDSSAASSRDALVAVQNHETTTQLPTDRPQLHKRNPRYQLSKDDILQLNFALTPEFNQTVTIQPDGFITLLGVGDLHVEGQTVPEVTESIKAAYGKTLHNPILTVRLTDFEKPYFIAGGEVAHPGKFELRGDTTLVQAVAIAGGFTDSAKHSQVWLFRRVSNEWVETKRYDLKKMLKDGNLQEDAELQPGDMLYVPRNTFSKIKRFIPVATLGTYLSPGTL